MGNERAVSAPRLLQAVGAGSAIYGALLLTAPRAAVRAVGGGSTPPASWIVRVLGGRQLGQGIALLLRPARSTVAASAAVDGLHALTMVAAAIGWPRYRRVSAASGAVAVATGVLAVASAR